MDIIFTNTSGYKELEPPQPASKFIPDWYKHMESYIGGEKTVDLTQGVTLSTAKKCMPVFDSITAGYILVTPADVHVKMIDGKQFFQWAHFKLVEFHPITQAPHHPAQNRHDYPKWINFWGIKTPKGYSTLFIPPVHRPSVFSILPGLVDTDNYSVPVNFPFTMHDPDFEGLIPKGTLIAQLIPIKRDSWSMKFGGEKELEEQSLQVMKNNVMFFDKYKTLFRKNKEYK